MQSGYYSYKKPNTNIKIKYTIEFTRDKKILDSMEKSDFTFDMLDKREFDFLEDAINVYNVLYYDDTVLYIMLFEQVILDDEIILEQFKDMTSINILPHITQNKINKVELRNKLLIEENEQMEAFIKKYEAEELFEKFIKEKLPL